MAKPSQGTERVGTPDKSEAEIMRDMNDTLKRMHKMPPKPHKLSNKKQDQKDENPEEKTV